MINKKELIRNFSVIGLALITLISFVFLVFALTSDERQSFNDELNINDYSSFVNINLNEFINNDNLMLSIDNKILTS